MQARVEERSIGWRSPATAPATAGERVIQEPGEEAQQALLRDEVGEDAKASACWPGATR
jgi:hypothetical protein